jgi:hypothetical protein
MNLDERVLAYTCLELPGQPPFVHMGTSYLIHDLHKEVKELKSLLKEFYDWTEYKDTPFAKKCLEAATH